MDHHGDLRRYPGQTGAAVIRGGSVHTGRGGIDAAERNETPLYGQGGANRAPDNGLRLIVDAAAAPGAAPTRAAPLPAVAGIGGQLQVNVDTRARVSIDDSLVGRAAPGEPLELRGLPVGEHRVEVSAAGYQTLNARHAVTAGQWTQVVVLMQPSPAPGTPAVADAQPSWTSTRLGLPAILLALVLGGLGLFVIRAALARRRATPDLAPLPSLPPAMIALPGGAFRMGSRPDEPECGPDEGPRHMVHIAPFAIGKTAVTFAQYDAFCAATQRPKRPSDQGWGRRERPVIDVSWDDALAYAAWLSQETGESYRLPSEAEWEYAARAGTKTAFWTGACIDTDRANYDGNQDYHGCGAKTGLYRKQTVPAGSLPANPWGLHEVHGNVREWVQDCYHDSYVGAPTDGSAWELGGSTARVARGGSWSCQPSRVRAACRLALQPGNRGGRLGFRLAKDLPASSE